MAEETVMAQVEARQQQKKQKSGLLDVIQNLDGEKVRRRDYVVNTAWYKFLIIMLGIGGVATLGWINFEGYRRGASQVQPIDLLRLKQEITSSVVQQQEMTLVTVKAALAETETILSSADRIAKQMRPPQEKVVIRDSASTPTPAPPPVELPKPEPPANPPSIWNLNK